VAILQHLHGFAWLNSAFLQSYHQAKPFDRRIFWPFGIKLNTMKSKVTQTVTLTPLSSNTPPNRKPVFLPSQNWTSLRKSLPKQPSKKRKLEAEQPSKKPTKTKNHVKITKQTTYNPWRPNDSSFRGNGNPALVLHSESTDKIIKLSRP
jgi:hypothetical protein